MGLPGAPRAKKTKKGDSLPVRSGSQEGHFWAQFGAKFSKGPFFTCFFVTFVWSLKKQRKLSSPRGGGYAIRPRRRMFRKGRPLSLWLHFGLHFGVILGAKFATILLFGRPGGQNRVTKERVTKCRKHLKFWVPAGGGATDVGSVVTPLRLVTFGVETEAIAREGLLFQDLRDICSAERTDFQSVLS